MDPQFLALLNEGKFTADLLSAGATQIGVANYASRGIYFQAFTSLSTGLERIGKLCILLDYYIAHAGSFPNTSLMKNLFRHDLELIYEKSREIAVTHDVSFTHLKALDSNIHKTILSILSDFAKGDRYANIDILTGAAAADPIGRWSRDVDAVLFATRVSENAKKKITRNAEIAEVLLGPHSFVQHHSEEGGDINSVLEASFRSGMWHAVAPYRRLNVLQIIRYWSELLMQLQYKAMEIKNNCIPHFSELFGKFYNKDSYLKSRKVWTGI